MSRELLHNMFINVCVPRHLRCLMPLCKAVAFMMNSLSYHQIQIPVSSGTHNHPADFEYKSRLELIGRLRDQAVSTYVSIDKIYTQEYRQYQLECGGNTERWSTHELVHCATVIVLVKPLGFGWENCKISKSPDWDMISFCLYY